MDCFLLLPPPQHKTPTYSHVTLAACVVNALFAVCSLAGNGLVLTAIWKKKTLRTTPNILFGCLALTDLTVALLIQPSYVVYKIADVHGVSKFYCTAGLFAETVGPFLICVSALTLTTVAIERLSQSFSIRRAMVVYSIILFLPVPLVILRLSLSTQAAVAVAVTATFGLLVGFCFLLTPFIYFKIFKIIRCHQRRIHVTSKSQTQRTIAMLKYKRSVVTVCLVLFLFLLTSVPYGMCVAVFLTRQKTERTSTSLMAGLNATSTIIFLNSVLNPIVYSWRISEIRKCSKEIIKNMFCWETGGAIFLFVFVFVGNIVYSILFVFTPIKINVCRRPFQPVFFFFFSTDKISCLTLKQL